MNSLKIFCLLCLFTFTACSPVSFFSSGIATLDTTSQERGLGGYVSDAEIQTRLNVLYFEHNHILHYRINITVYEGRVLLTGVLESKQMQEDAVRLAWQVPGVKTVIDETLAVGKRTVAEYTSDKILTMKLNGKLFLDRKISSRNFEVVVVKGVVYLVGIAFDEKELQQILDLCRHASGVKKVVSYIRLMSLYERRRRRVFNKRKYPTPLENSRADKKISENPARMKTSWTQPPADQSIYETDIKKKHT